MLCNDFSKRTGTSWTKSFGPLRELWDLLRKNVPIIGRKGIRTEGRKDLEDLVYRLLNRFGFVRPRPGRLAVVKLEQAPEFQQS